MITIINLLTHKNTVRNITLSLTLYNPNHQCQIVPLGYGIPMDNIL